MTTRFSTHIMAPTINRVRTERSSYNGALNTYLVLDDGDGDVTLSGTPDELRAFANDLLAQLWDVEQ